jgi:hypothetical protein
MRGLPVCHLLSLGVHSQLPDNPKWEAPMRALRVSPMCTVFRFSAGLMCALANSPASAARQQE